MIRRSSVIISKVKTKQMKNSKLTVSNTKNQDNEKFYNIKRYSGLLRQFKEKITKIKLLAILVLSVVSLISCKKDNNNPASQSTSTTVSSTGPSANATGVPRNTAITSSFSSAVNPATLTTSTFTLTQGGTAVAGTVGYSGTTAT